MKRLNEFELAEIATPAGNPDANYIYVYPKSDGKLYKKNDAGNEEPIGDQTGYFFVDSSFGDGVTDATAEIQDAVDRASAAGGGTVFIPHGQYNVSATIIIETSKINILGSGAGTEIWGTTDFGDILYFRPDTVPPVLANYFHDIGVYNLSIQSSVARTSGYAIRTNFTHSATISDVVIGFIKTGETGSNPFYKGISFENESNAILRNTQVYAWKTGVYFTGTFIGDYWLATNCFDGLITGNCFIMGDITKWDPEDQTYGLHIAGGCGGVQLEAANISYYTNNIRIDRSANDTTNYDIFIQHAFASDNSGADGIYIAANSIYSLNMSGSWSSASGNSVLSHLLYIESPNPNLRAYITGGGFHDSYNGSWPNVGGNGFYIGAGTLIICGAQFYNNGAGTDLIIGEDVTEAVITGNLIGSVENLSGIIPQYCNNTGIADNCGAGSEGGGIGGTIATGQVPYGVGADVVAGNSGFTYNGTDLTFAGKLTNSNHSTTGFQTRVGSFLTQSYSLNNGFITDNGYFTGTTFTRIATGYASGFQFLNGQLLIFNEGEAAGDFAQDFQLKTDYSGRFGLGASISPNSADFTGATFFHDGGTGSTGMGASAPSIAVTAVLDIKSTTKGVLLPRMSKTQRDTISSPATGLMIYQTDNTPGLRVWNGTSWMRYSETAD